MAEKDTSDNTGDVAGHFKDIVKDLFNIEVNTILRDNISAQKMPSPRHALLDIGSEYYEILRKMEISHRLFHRASLRESRTEEIEGDAEFGSVEFDDMRRKWGFYTQEEIDENTSGDKKVHLVVQSLVYDQLGGFAAFDIMRTWADKFLGDPFLADPKKKYLTDTQLSVLPRIRDNADMLKGMFIAMCRRDNKLKEKGLANEMEKKRGKELTPVTVVELSQKIDLEQTLMLTNQYTRSEIVSTENLSPLPLKDSELVLIRKVWEIGTEVIAMQTTIQVDGDVITRLNPNFMDDKESQYLRAYHNEGVRIALSYWGNLITVAKELVLAIGRGVSNKL